MTASSGIPVEAVAASGLFRRLHAVRGIEIDLRYATANNFAGRVLYTGLDCDWVREEAAAGLEAAARALAEVRPGWRVRVLDALRPQRIQEAIWVDIQGSGMEPYFAHPARGSIHSYGFAVDVTLLDPAGREADMGSGFDEMTLRSHPALHAEHLATGVLTPAQVAERETLRDAMAAGGFHGIASEWWHFEWGDRERVRQHEPRVL